MNQVAIKTPLSREGRDTLWLLGVLALSIYPHAGHMPWWCISGVSVALLWRGYLAVQDAPLPPRWVLLVAMLISIGLTFLTFRSIFGREAGITLVSVLAGLKTLELRARRDAFVITSLGFFLILTQFLYSQSIFTAALMSVVFWGLLTSLVLAQRPLYRPTIWSAMKAAGRTVLMGVPTMLVLYVLFPRLGPLWAVPADAQTSIGLSDHLSLGHVAELAQDDGIAMRIKFDGPIPEPAQRYFRGPVLELFDGKQWLPRPDLTPEDRHGRAIDEVRLSGPALSYEVTLEAPHLTVLPMLDGTLELQNLSAGQDLHPSRLGLQWNLRTSLNERTQWRGKAWTQFASGPVHWVPELGALLQLPRALNPRTVAWAHELQQKLGGPGQAAPHQLVDAVMRHIATQGYTYTLAPGETETRPDGQPELNLIDQFWMDRKTGFCEHFATAFVVLMRAMGIPSRVVTGYQGMERNDIDGLYVVRNSHAHAWAEYWRDGIGWVRADPTAAVAPDRIELNRPLIRPRGGLAGALPELDSPFWKHARSLVEATNHRWNVWVLEYSRGRQLELLRQWGWQSPDWVALIRLCAATMATVSAAGIVWLWFTRPRTPVNPWKKVHTKVHRALLSIGLDAPEFCPAPAPALTWSQHLKHLQTQASEMTLMSRVVDQLQALDALQYGPQSRHDRETHRIARTLV
ncbi:MAG TPA: DUF3488 and transglutaminase-like domain-containing protein, partial [Aquabacterium sp.]|nr:DUF3488 and transglutaminase-like domain-containing protein [Aquabacterium sp.]